MAKRKRAPKGVGSIQQKHGQWWVVTSVADPVTGKRSRPWHGPFDSHDDAVAESLRLGHERATGTYTKPTATTVADHVETWVPAIRASVKPTTIASYEATLRLHVLPHLGTVRLRDLTPAHCNRLYGDLLENGRTDGTGGLSATSVRYVHTVLRRCLADAVRWGVVPRNVADLADPPAKDSAEMHTWSREQLHRFLSVAAEHRLGAAYLLAAATTMRRGELAGLRWRDVHLDTVDKHGQPAPYLSVVNTRVLAGRHAAVVEGTPKSRLGRRRIDLDPGTVDVLRRHRARQAAERLAAGPAWTDSGDVFVNADGGPVHPAALSRTFAVLLGKVDVPTIRLHDLRHTAIALGIAAGISPKVMQERAGHHSAAFTMDRYGHVAETVHREAAERWGALVHGPTEARR